jgi:hypothetical protein
MKEPRILGFSPWTAAALKLPKTQIFEEAIDERVCKEDYCRKGI